MGKGDKRTRKGKIYAGSYGNARPQGASRAIKAAAPVAVKKAAAPAKKAAGKKA